MGKGGAPVNENDNEATGGGAPQNTGTQTTKPEAKSTGGAIPKNPSPPPNQPTVDTKDLEEAKKLVFRSKELVGGINEALSKLTCAINERDEDQAELYLELLEHKNKRLETVNTALVNLTKGSSGHQYILDTEYYQEELVKARLKFEKFIAKMKKENEGDTTSKCVTQKETNMLPKIELKKFNGNYKEWSKWWTAFDIVVHSTALEATTKFKILKLKLEDEIADSIAYLDENLDESYDTAIKKLRQRFERKDLEANRHLDAIYNLQPVTKIEDYKGLRKLHSQAMTHAMALGKPNVKNDLNNRLTQLILRKLPLKMISDWNASVRASSGDLYSSPDLHSLEDLLDNIEGVATDYEIAAESHAATALKTKEAVEKIKVVETTQATATELAVTSSATNKNKQSSKCPFCKSDSHYAVNCSLTVDQRFEALKKERRCARCLRVGHLRYQCRGKSRCSICKKTHHTSLCLKQKETVEKKDEKEPCDSQKEKTVLTFCTENSMKPSCLSSKLFDGVFLKSATILIDGPMQSTKAMCLVDDGANACLIKKDLAQRLKLKSIGKFPLKVQAVGKKHPEQEYEVFEFSIRGTSKNAPPIKVTAIGYEQIANVSALPQTSFVKALIANNYQLADERLTKGDAPEADIEFLLGANAIWQIMKSRQISADGMHAQESALGWLLIGQDPEVKETNQNLILACSSKAASAIETHCDTQRLIDDNDVSFDLRLFFESQQLTLEEKETTQDEIWKKIKSSITREPSGHFSVALPWRLPRELLKTNEAAARAQLASLYKRLLKNPSNLICYHKEMVKLKQLNFVKESNPDYKGTYTLVPHMPVIREDKTTSTVRPVFNASFFFASGLCLNAFLDPGPNMNPNVFDVLCRFRLNKIAFVADIQKAFLQIELKEEDKEAIRFLWQFEEPPAEPKMMSFKVLPFGLTCSPALLRIVLLKLFEDNAHEYTVAVEALSKQLFMDDALLTAPNLECAIRMLDQLVKLFGIAKMVVHKMNTNNKEFKEILRQRKVLDESVSLLDTLRSSTKALGLRWDTETDEFWFEPNEIVNAALSCKKITKRVISKYSSKAYDPPGVISPVILQFKILFQEIWKLKIDWDCEVPEATAGKWKALMEHLRNLISIRVPRYIQCDTPVTIGTIKRQMHVFCDALLLAYGAVAYSRTVQDNNASIVLLASKTRVCAISHELSIARIELEAADLGTQLAKRLVNAYDQIDWEVFLYTDSMIAFAWINGDLNRWKVWVRNRVEKILLRFGKSCWRHCPGSENPADLASRGCSAEKLSRSSSWWAGPSWLSQPQEHWPKASELTMEEKSIVEKEAKAKIVTITTLKIEHSPLIAELVSRCGTFSKLNRVLCFVLRFIRNARNSARRRNNRIEINEVQVSAACEEIAAIKVPCISAAELALGEKRLIQEAQRQSLAKEINAIRNPSESRKALNDIISLRPSWDEQNGLIRVTGRVKNVLAHEKRQGLILLPPDNSIVKLLIEHVHRQVMHLGLHSTMTRLLETYYIIRCRQQIKNVLRRCVTCKRAHSRHFDEVPADLPKDRVLKAKQFELVGVDFAGPLKVRESRKIRVPGPGNQLTEIEYEGVSDAHIALFTCAVSRAVHIEVVGDLTVKQFMDAFRRFVARRGECKVVYSDNAPTYCASARILTVLQENPELAEFLAIRGISWKFSAPLAPWWGGFWERMIRTVKEISRKVLGAKALDFSELTAHMAEVEATINNRPLAYVSSEPESIILTPNLLITGKKSVADPALSPPVINEEDPDFNQSDALDWYYCRLKLTLEWYRQWRSKYLLELKNFRARGTPTIQPKVGDVVLIEEQNQKRRRWPLAVIEETIHGADGRIRLVKLRTAGGKHLNRAIQRIYPLELCETQPDTGESADREANNSILPDPIEKTGERTRVQPIEEESSESESAKEAEPKENVDQTADAACRGEDVDTRKTSSGRAVRKPARYR